MAHLRNRALLPFDKTIFSDLQLYNGTSEEVPPKLSNA